jgi:AcrR family transcriptional regulator
MSRWAPNARERLIEAALELFVETGYEQTTVAQIAQRAGMNRATFFRHFADKREVLFGGEEALAGLFAEAIRAAPAPAEPVACLRAALAAAETVMTPGLRAAAVRRRAVVAGNSELQERAALKHARTTESVAAALRERGADELTARLGAQAGMLAFAVAFERWIAAERDEPFAPLALAALDEVRERAAVFAPGPRVSV